MIHRKKCLINRSFPQRTKTSTPPHCSMLPHHEKSLGVSSYHKSNLGWSKFRGFLRMKNHLWSQKLEYTWQASQFSMVSTTFDERPTTSIDIIDVSDQQAICKYVVVSCCWATTFDAMPTLALLKHPAVLRTSLRFLAKFPYPTKLLCIKLVLKGYTG